MVKSTTRSQVRNVLLLTLAWAYIGISDGRLAAAPLTETAYCGDSICQAEGCSFGGNETPGNGCVEDGGNCPADCGYCGDTYCSSELDEDWESCTYDCGYCGDGVCIHPYESNPSYRCEEDCGDASACSPEECETNGDCGNDEVCSPGRCCVPESPIINPPYCGGICLSNDDCCGGDVCVSDGTGQYPQCALPGKPSEICPSAPTCNEHSDCGGGLPNQYCDFSIRTGICRYPGSPYCVPSSG